MGKSYLRGKPSKAACALIDLLWDRGIVATVGYASKTQFPNKISELIVIVRSGDVGQVPVEFCGYPTRIEREAAHPVAQ